MSAPELHDDEPEVIVRVMATGSEQASTQHLADALLDEAQATADPSRDAGGVT